MTAEAPKILAWLDRGFAGSIFLLALAAPLSIAGTQTAWAFALLFWLLRLFYVRPSFPRDGIPLAVLAFVGLTLISSIFSYEPEVSLRKMVAVSLVSIVFLVLSAVKTDKLRRLATIILLTSATFASIYSLANAAIGRNLKVLKMTAESPLRAWGIQENDTIQRADGVSVNSPEELSVAITANSSDGNVELKVYRFEVVYTYSMPVGSLSPLSEPGFLGITEWSRGRDVRASGFYGHYTTFAEALQLVGSLALGLLILTPGGLFARNRLLLAAAVAMMAAALVLTVTRASWGGFALSGAIIVLVGASRKVILICILAAIPLAAAGAYYLQQKRNVGFVDSSDNSTTWRTTVWREAIGVLVSQPRHLAVGVGMDSVKKRWQDWGMFDNGKLPTGHMHSTPIAFAFERGIPTLVVWLIWMFLYLRMLWLGVRQSGSPWLDRGIMLGCLGGAAGFLAGGLVHYNWGDSEVAMIFYLLMGLSLSIPSRKAESELPEAR
jgi:hypothetical protein